MLCNGIAVRRHDAGALDVALQCGTGAPEGASRRRVADDYAWEDVFIISTATQRLATMIGLRPPLVLGGRADSVADHCFCRYVENDLFA
jgi:hypothetical protein